MNRPLLQSTAFVGSVQRLLKRSPQFADAVQAAMELLSENAAHPTLKIHKLKGDLSDRYAISVAYDLRIVFRFVQDEGEEAIMLMSIGTHDDVY